jgi:hypothetical protein
MVTVTKAPATSFSTHHARPIPSSRPNHKSSPRVPHSACPDNGRALLSGAGGFVEARPTTPCIVPSRFAISKFRKKKENAVIPKRSEGSTSIASRSESPHVPKNSHPDRKMSRALSFRQGTASAVPKQCLTSHFRLRAFCASLRITRAPSIAHWDAPASPSHRRKSSISTVVYHLQKSSLGA